MGYKELIKRVMATLPPSPVLFELINAYEILAKQQEKRENADYYTELYGDEAKEVLGMLKGKTISREQVEKVWRGEWEMVSNGKGICSECHRQDGIDPLAKFCRYCGAPMTDEAVEMVMERWKEELE